VGGIPNRRASMPKITTGKSNVDTSLGEQIEEAECVGESTVM